MAKVLFDMMLYLVKKKTKSHMTDKLIFNVHMDILFSIRANHPTYGTAIAQIVAGLCARRESEEIVQRKCTCRLERASICAKIAQSL